MKKKENTTEIFILTGIGLFLIVGVLFVLIYFNSNDLGSSDFVVKIDEERLMELGRLFKDFLKKKRRIPKDIDELKNFAKGKKIPLKIFKSFRFKNEFRYLLKGYSISESEINTLSETVYVRTFAQNPPDDYKGVVRFFSYDFGLTFVTYSTFKKEIKDQCDYLIDYTKK